MEQVRVLVATRAGRRRSTLSRGLIEWGVRGPWVGHLGVRGDRGDEVFGARSRGLNVLGPHLEHLFEVDRYVGQLSLQQHHDLHRLALARFNDGSTVVRIHSCDVLLPGQPLQVVELVHIEIWTTFAGRISENLRMIDLA